MYFFQNLTKQYTNSHPRFRTLWTTTGRFPSQSVFRGEEMMNPITQITDWYTPTLKLISRIKSLYQWRVPLIKSGYLLFVCVCVCVKVIVWLDQFGARPLYLWVCLESCANRRAHAWSVLLCVLAELFCHSPRTFFSNYFTFVITMNFAVR